MKITRTFYNVGDALFTKEILSVDSKSYTIMYDCGSTKEEVIKEAIEDTEKIDAIFLSHYHADHIRGLQKILENVEVKRLILPMIPYPNACLAICMNMEEDENLLWDFYIDPQSVLGREIPITYVYGEGYQEERNFDKADLFLSETPTRDIELSQGQLIKIDKKIDWIYLPFNPFPFDKKKEDDFFKNLSKAVDCVKSINRTNIKEIWKEKKLKTEIREKSLEILKRFPQRPTINATSMTLYSGPCDNNNRDRLMGCLYTGDYDAKDPYSIDNILIFYSDYLDNIDVIQVPHHGSEYNNAELFYHPFKGKVAILSVREGTKNIAGVDKTIKMLDKKHLKTYKTDFKGEECYGHNGIIQKISKGVRIIQPFSLYLAAFLRTILVFITFCLSLHSHAQDLSVRSFNVDLSDQTANVKERLDLNKQPCGLIKVSLPLQGVVFEGDIIGEVEYSAGEYYVYMIDDTEILTIKHDNFHALNLTLPEKVKSRRTYRLIVNVPTNESFSKNSSIKEFKKGYEYYDKGDYINALIFFKQLADNENNLDAQNLLGIMFAEAYGVQQNYKEAIKYFTKSAEQGNAEAQCNLGRIYMNGEGVPQNYAMAAKWYYKSAEQGITKAQKIMGYLYEFGRGVNQSYVEAIKWYRKAAEQGYAEAQLNLGAMYYTGRGMSPNYTEAVKWFRKTAEQGNAMGQTFLGHMYDEGLGVARNYVEAAKWYRKAAEQGYAAAQFALGVMYCYGNGVSQDYTEAAKWHRKSAEQGFKEAQCTLGQLYYYGDGVSQDNIEAAKWLRKSAEQGYQRAKDILIQLEGSY